MSARGDRAAPVTKDKAPQDEEVYLIGPVPTKPRPIKCPPFNPKDAQTSYQSTELLEETEEVCWTVSKSWITSRESPFSTRVLVKPVIQ